jgi:hypothetical protein
MKDETEELYLRVQADLARERGVRAFLRSRPTVLRGLLLGATSLATVSVAALVSGSPRSPGFWLGTLALIALVGVAARSALRPLHRPAWTGGARASVVATIVLGALGAIVLPSDGSLGAMGPGICIAIGVAAAVPVFVLAVLLDRSPWRGALFGALAGGLTGALAVQLLCPEPGLAHLATEHFGVLLVCGVLFGVIAQLLGRRDADPRGMPARWRRAPSSSSWHSSQDAVSPDAVARSIEPSSPSDSPRPRRA